MMYQDESKSIALFQSHQIRRTWHDERWYFVVEDVVLVLTGSKNVKDYITKMKERDQALSQGYGQFVSTLRVETKGGPQKMNCADVQGILRIIQSIPSPNAEPFKLWLAQVGKERIDEIRDPELAVNRAKAIYERKGYPRDWIDKRLRGINVRNTLTDEWKARGLKEGKEFAILTDEIYKGAFDFTTQEYKKHKSLSKENNLRDHMEDLELILTMLGEATTTRMTKERDSDNFDKMHKDSKEGGEVAGKARVDIEGRLGKKIVSKKNFLPGANNKLPN